MWHLYLFFIHVIARRSLEMTKIIYLFKVLEILDQKATRLIVVICFSGLFIKLFYNCQFKYRFYHMSVQILPGMELIFFAVGCMALCFGFVTRTTLITQQCFGCSIPYIVMLSNRTWGNLSKAATVWRLSGYQSACGRYSLTTFASLFFFFLFPSLIKLSLPQSIKYLI